MLVSIQFIAKLSTAPSTAPHKMTIVAVPNDCSLFITVTPYTVVRHCIIDTIYDCIKLPSYTSFTNWQAYKSFQRYRTIFQHAYWQYVMHSNPASWEWLTLSSASDVRVDSRDKKTEVMNMYNVYTQTPDDSCRHFNREQRLRAKLLTFHIVDSKAEVDLLVFIWPDQNDAAPPSLLG